MFRILSAWHLSRRGRAAGHGSIPLYADRLSRWLLSRFDAKTGLFPGELFTDFGTGAGVRHHPLTRSISPRSEGHRTTCRSEMLSLQVPCVGRRQDETICSDHVDRDGGRFGR